VPLDLQNGLLFRVHHAFLWDSFCLTGLLREGDPDRTLIFLDPLQHYNVKLFILFYFVNTNVEGKQLLLYLFNALQKKMHCPIWWFMVFNANFNKIL
jgi:hypothetical protein